MFASFLRSNSLLVALVASTLVAGSALAGHGGHGGGGGGGGGNNGWGGGGGNSWSGGGGGGGGGNSSMRSFHSNGGGGGGNSMRSWSGGSQSSPSMRSFRSSGGDNSTSSWSGGSFQRSWSGGNGGNNQPTISGRSMRSFSDSAGGNQQGSSSQFRNFSGGNLSGNNPSGQSGDAMRQYRAYRPQDGDGSNRNFAAGGTTGQQPGNNQLRDMFKKYDQQQAVHSDGGKSFDRSRDRNWAGNNDSSGQTAFQQLPGGNNDGNRGRGDRNQSVKDGAMKDGSVKQASGTDNFKRFRDGGNNGSGNVNGNGKHNDWLGNVDSKQSLENQIRRERVGDGGPGGKDVGQFGKWSKKDGGVSNPQTARWFGDSGFGDHRGRGNEHNGNHDNKFADSVRKNWQNEWSNKHGDHDDHGNRGDHDHGDFHGNHGGGWWGNDFPFCFTWWGGRNLGFHYYWNDRCWRDDPFFWWGGCSAPLLTSWVNFGWNYPCYWDYGPGEYITYYNNTVYVDNQRYTTALDYYAQVRNLARSVPPLTQKQLAGIEWLPLGVFAVTRPGANQANELVQLAVSKDGILSGTLLNQQTGQARPLQGMVEQSTQKAAWMFADSPTDALVVETSLYNLTAPECTALAHLDAVNTEVWQLVRLQQPQQPAGAAAAGPAPAGAVGAPAPAARPVLPPQGAVQ